MEEASSYVEDGILEARRVIDGMMMESMKGKLIVDLKLDQVQVHPWFALLFESVSPLFCK